LLCCVASVSLAQDEEDEPTEPPAGLIGVYTGADGSAHARVDDRLRFTWNGVSPDPRVPAGPFTANWQGNLSIYTPGAYRFYVYAGGGAVELRLAGKTLLASDTGKPQWMDSAPVELDFGEQSLEVRFRAIEGTSQIGLYWSGPKFQLEPVPPRFLSHAHGKEALREFDEGRLLVRALRCAACHNLPDAQPILPAPALTHINGNLDHEWLMTWIGGKPAQPAAAKQSDDEAQPSDAPPPTDNLQFDNVKFRMPGLGASRADAQHIAAWLLANSHPAPPTFVPPSDPPVDARAQEKAEKPDGKAKDKADFNSKKKSKSDRDADDDEDEGKSNTKRKTDGEPDAAIGQELFLTLGCLACHQFQSLGAGGVYGGGDLSAIAAKRPADFFVRWLAEPHASNPSHRMPVFSLSAQQRGDLAEFLSEQGTPAAEVREPPGDPRRGAELISAHRCAVCHALTDNAKADAKSPKPAAVKNKDLGANPDWQASCLGEPDVARHRPGYRLRPEQRTAIERYIRELPRPVAEEKTPPRPEAQPESGPPQNIDAARLVTERNCLACHTRGLNAGVVAKSPALAEAHPELASLLPALAPPSLTDVGDKLERDAIIAAITTSTAPLRPWLKIRMPRFTFTPAESQALAEWFAECDLVPARPAVIVPAAISDAALAVAGRRLVTAEGFGCASCHQIGQSVPKQDNVAAMGTDLSMVGRRIRRSWYDRWVRNPARIVPRMEMPSIEMPVRGVLDEKVDDQLAAVWHVLNLPKFTPPEPGAVRTVRARNLPDTHERAAILTDVLKVDQQTFSRPFAVVLSNRHTAMFDLQYNRLAGWWIGDAALQRTRGKTWFWEAGGTHLIEATIGEPELQLRVNGRLLTPVSPGQFAVELDAWRHAADGVTFDYRLTFADESAKQSVITLRASQSFSPVWQAGDKQGGFRRRIEVAGLPAGAELLWRLLPEGLEETRSSDRVTARGPSGALTVQVAESAQAKFTDERGPARLALRNVAPNMDEKGVSAEVIYTSALASDRFPLAPPPAVNSTIASLDVTPGWNAVRLPLPADQMPTGFAWRDDGAMVFSSLKGQVWLATDTDKDNLPETLTALSDELAAPYGVAVRDGAIDVINKSGVVRLSDFDADGRAQRSEVVASGWGHTDDYHDWAVAIVPDGAGGYFTAIPCYQNQRDEAAARHRGFALRLKPKQPTQDSPRRYELETFCGGVRFPMGLARNRGGLLFASDNQGNYNPFNELNHLVTGAHYGFFNKQEPLENRPPRRDPAIEIPHPWTRSVNGICFLETPQPLRDRTGRSTFGPWEGHLIGCEYDTRRLVRMSLQQVEDVYQGAVYPLSVDPPEEGETFDGPVSCAVGPDGALYIGNIRDSGWGGGQNTGSIVRMTMADTTPAGIAEVQAAADGFLIQFTQPVDADRAAQRESYDFVCYRRVSTPDYGGPDVDRHPARVTTVTLSQDRKQAHLSIERLHQGFVYEVRVKNLTKNGVRFHPAEAYYTLRKIPAGRPEQ